MIKNGLRPIEPDTRDYDFHQTFGAVAKETLPDSFDIDSGFGMLDQMADGLPYGCTGYSQGELCQAQDRIDFSERAIYEKTLEREGNAGDYTQGCQIRNSLQIVVDFFGRGGYYTVKPTVDYFEGVRSALWVNRNEHRAVSLGFPWFSEIEQTGNDGIVTETFQGDVRARSQDPFQSWHNCVAVGWVTIAGKPYLKVKAWQGTRIGDRGWLYFSAKTINLLLSIGYTGAFTVSKRIVDPKVTQETLNLIEKLLKAISDWLKLKYPKIGSFFPSLHHYKLVA